jgi:hypothetical protein
VGWKRGYRLHIPTYHHKVAKKEILEICNTRNYSHSWHTNDHVIIVRVEIFTLGDIDTEWGLVVVTGQDVEDVVNTTWSESDLTQVDGPDTTISVLTL